MNASDIVNAKQNKVLYTTLYTPNVYQSTIFSTLRTYSSINTGSSIISSYISCINTAYKYTCNPVFTSYETRNDVKDGAVACGAVTLSNLQFVNSDGYVYAYSTLYSSFGPSTIILPSSFTITSTLGSIANVPVICPINQFYQGCSVCTNQSCKKCLSGL
jgi:hypothetical protein